MKYLVIVALLLLSGSAFASGPGGYGPGYGGGPGYGTPPVYGYGGYGRPMPYPAYGGYGYGPRVIHPH